MIFKKYRWFCYKLEGGEQGVEHYIKEVHLMNDTWCMDFSNSEIKEFLVDNITFTFN